MDLRSHILNVITETPSLTEQDLIDYLSPSFTASQIIHELDWLVIEQVIGRDLISKVITLHPQRDPSRASRRNRDRA